MKLLAEHALLPSGWARGVLITITDGRIEQVEQRSTERFAERVAGLVLPGMPNVHSHAFQRAMAGLAERRTHATDSFWTWRELMYRFAARITPAQMFDIAAWLYVEMLKAGYTSVAEFHYIHRDAQARPYSDPGEMSHRLIAAAGAAGIALTHLPVLYAYGGFGGRAPSEAQKRFVLSAEEYAALVSALSSRLERSRDARVGIAFHSLRAVDEALMRATLAAIEGLSAKSPIHIHVSEQQREVEECLAATGKRPVEWLLDHFALGERWCLVHATHLDADEARRLAESGAVAGLCPSTEANLGDGIFPMASFASGTRAGRFAIGSDSHVSVSVAEELRLLEYGQRLAGGRRSALATSAEPSPGQAMYVQAAIRGAQAVGLETGRIAPGHRADLVVLDPAHRALWNVGPEHALDAWIFAGDSACVRDVMVGGSWRVRDRRHEREDELAMRFRRAQAELVE
ncbi:MAG TPA: formimidoylglutamate deiminase [Usitatibacter sp.]|nr:formimidoylglutamate deiminase [Usitatibacter sp.]